VPAFCAGRGKPRPYKGWRRTRSYRTRSRTEGWHG
jgi:hypothetical protein